MQSIFFNEILHPTCLIFSQLSAPLIYAEINNKPKTLYMTSTAQMREATEPHLKMTLQGFSMRNDLLFYFIRIYLLIELGLTNNSELLVGDPARATSMRVILSLTSSMETSSK